MAKAADPPVWLTKCKEPTSTWTLAAPTFSSYVYAEAWDLALFAESNEATSGDAPLGDGDLALLRPERGTACGRFG